MVTRPCSSKVLRLLVPEEKRSNPNKQTGAYWNFLKIPFGHSFSSTLKYCALIKQNVYFSLFFYSSELRLYSSPSAIWCWSPATPATCRAAWTGSTSRSTPPRITWWFYARRRWLPNRNETFSDSMCKESSPSKTTGTTAAAQILKKKNQSVLSRLHWKDMKSRIITIVFLLIPVQLYENTWSAVIQRWVLNPDSALQSHMKA